MEACTWCRPAKPDGPQWPANPAVVAGFARFGSRQQQVEGLFALSPGEFGGMREVVVRWPRDRRPECRRRVPAARHHIDGGDVAERVPSADGEEHAYRRFAVGAAQSQGHRLLLPGGNLAKGDDAPGIGPLVGRAAGVVLAGNRTAVYDQSVRPVDAKRCAGGNVGVRGDGEIHGVEFARSFGMHLPLRRGHAQLRRGCAAHHGPGQGGPGGFAVDAFA